MNGRMQYRHRLLWLSNPQKHPRYFIGTSSGFSSKMKSIFKTLNDSNINLDKCPTSNVRQLAKKMESLKVTTRLIKQVASELHMAYINLMRHQCTNLPANKQKKRMSFVKPRPPSHKNDTSDRQHSNKKGFDTKNVYKKKER